MALQPQDLILTILGDYVLARPRSVWSGGLVRLLEGFGFSSASGRLALSRLGRRGLIRRTRGGRLTYYALTDAGTRLLDEGKRRIFSFGAEEAWDGVWTILSYSIPEDRRAVRDRLRKRLAFLGFASLHDATWFSPRDREDAVAVLLVELGLDADAEVFLGRPGSRTDVAELVARAWDLAALRDRYASFVEEFEPYAGRAAQRRLSDEEAFVTRTRVMHAYRRFPTFDPELPEEIVGAGWRRSRAVATFHAVYDGLAARAERHFELTTDVGQVADRGMSR